MSTRPVPHATWVAATHGPSRLDRAFSVVAVAEAFSWAGLLLGMYLKHVAGTTELGVRIFGSLHGALFVTYVGADRGAGAASLAGALDRRAGAGRRSGAVRDGGLRALGPRPRDRHGPGDGSRMISAGVGGQVRRTRGSRTA